METKQKTLAACKDEAAKKYGFDSFNQLIKAYIINLDYVVLNSRIDEAAELYAGQTKQSEPVSEDVEEAAKEYASDFSNPHDHKKNMKFSAAGIFYIRESTFKDAIKWQSQQPIKLSQIAFSEPYQNLQREYAQLKQKLEAQQPASVAFLSDQDVYSISHLVHYAHLPILGDFSKQDSLNFYIQAIEVAQCELRKRVIDPVRFLIWCEENDWTLIQAPGGKHEGNFQQRGKYYSTGQQLLQKYVDHLTSKTK